MKLGSERTKSGSQRPRMNYKPHITLKRGTLVCPKPGDKWESCCPGVICWVELSAVIPSVMLPNFYLTSVKEFWYPSVLALSRTEWLPRQTSAMSAASTWCAIVWLLVVTDMCPWSSVFLVVNFSGGRPPCGVQAHLIPSYGLKKHQGWSKEVARRHLKTAENWTCISEHRCVLDIKRGNCSAISHIFNYVSISLTWKLGGTATQQNWVFNLQCNKEGIIPESD